MITINGKKFYEEPTSCGTCPFLFVPGRDLPSSMQQHSDKYHCTLFDEMHASWIKPPRRCARLFRNAFKHPEGTDLVITRSENESTGNLSTNKEIYQPIYQS